VYFSFELHSKKVFVPQLRTGMRLCPDIVAIELHENKYLRPRSVKGHHIRHTTLYVWCGLVWTMGNMVWLYVFRLFPATARTFTNRSLSNKTKQIRLVFLCVWREMRRNMEVVWAYCERKYVACKFFGFFHLPGGFSPLRPQWETNRRNTVLLGS